MIENEKMMEHVLTPQSVGEFFRYISEILPDPDKILREKGYNYNFFRELLKEPFFDGVWEKRIGNLIRRNYYFIPPDESAQNVAIAGYFDSWMRKQNLHSLMSGFLEAVLFGYAPHEIIYRSEKLSGKEIWGIDSVSVKPQNWIGFDTDGTAKKRIGFSSFAELDPCKFVIARHGETYANPYGKKLISIIFWMLIFKKGGWRFFTLFIEKFGGAMAHSEISESKYEDDDFRKKVLEALDTLTSAGVAVFPEGSKTTVLESQQKTGSNELYKTYIDMCDKNIAICVLGETLSTSQGETGAKAATVVHNEVRKEKTDIDMGIVEPCMNMIVKYFSFLNYGVTDNIPVFMFERDRELNTALADRDEKLVKTYNIEFTAEYVEKHYKIDRKYFSKKSTESTQSFNNVSPLLKRSFSAVSGEEKQILKDDKLINEFAGSQAGKSQNAVDTLIDEIVESIDDISDENAVFCAIMKKYPDLNFSEITSIIENIRYVASQVGAFSERATSKKKSSGDFLKKTLDRLMRFFSRKMRMNF